jgi:hypothetical protein
VCATEYFFLNIAWKSFIFDSQKRKVFITQKSLWFNLKTIELSFENIKLILERQYMSPGRSRGGYAWVLEMVDKRSAAADNAALREFQSDLDVLGAHDDASASEQFTMDVSAFKTWLRKKKDKIEAFLKLYQ